MKKILFVLAFLFSFAASAQFNGCIYPTEGPYGNQIHKTYWYNTDGIGINGSATPTLNGSNIDVTGGSSGVYTNFLTFGGVDQMAHFHGTVRFKITAWTATSGIAIGRASINGTNNYDIANVLTLGTGGTSPVYISGLRDGTLFTTGSNFTFTLNDSVQVDVDLNVNVFTATAKNITTGGAAVTATKTWTTPTVGGAGGFWPNSGKFAIWSLGGTQQVYYMDVYSAETRWPSTMILGDSKIRFGTTTATTWINGAGDSINRLFPSCVIVCDEGSSVSEQIAGAKQSLSFAPRQFLVEASTNELRRGASMATFVHRLDTLFNLLNAPTHPVYFFMPPEDSTKSGVGLAEAHNYLLANYPNNYISNVWTVLGGGTNILVSTYTDGSGIHLSQAGHSALYGALLAWNKIQKRYCANRFEGFQKYGPGLIVNGDSLCIDTAYTKDVKPATTGGTVVNSVTATDGTMTISPNTGAVLVALNRSANNTILGNWIFQNVGFGNGAATYHISDGTTSGSTANTNLGGNLFTQAISLDNVIISNNSKFNGSVQQYTGSSFAYAQQYNGGDWNVYLAPSGTAGNTITYTRPFTVKNSGAIGTGGITSPVGWMHLPASTTAFSSLVIPVGVAPTSLVNGMIWSDNSLWYRTGGVSYNFSNPPATYAQLATTNTITINGGTSASLLPATKVLAGLLDSGRFATLDSLRAKTITGIGGSTASNGLTASAGNIVLGGALTGNTSITGASGSFNLSLGTNASELSSFSAYADGISLNTIGGGVISMNGVVNFISIASANGTANYSSSSDNYIELASPTANRTVTLPTAGSNTGRVITLLNKSTSSSFSWTFATTVIGVDGNTISSIPNFVSYNLFCDGTSWYVLNTYNVAGGSIKYQHTIFTPTTGGTVNLINNQYNIINPAGSLLAVTLNLPSSPSNNDVVYIKFTQTVSTVTYANGTVVDGIAAPVAGGLVLLTYDSGTTSWY